MNTQKKPTPIKQAVTKKKPKRQADIYTMRKQKKRKKILKRSIWCLLLVMLVIVLYQKRDVWLPRLETMNDGKHSTQYQVQNTSDSAFPIYVYSSGGYQADRLGGQLVVLSDTYLNIYETDGTLVSSRQHTYGNAILRTADTNALIYESGGMRFRLDTASKTKYEKTVSEPIICGSVSKGGLVALITAADTCASKLLVFNEKGNQIYERDCVDNLVAVSFLPDDSGCCAVSIGVNGGAMQSVVHQYGFSVAEEIWRSPPLDTFAISVYNTDDEGVCLIGDTKTVFLGAGGVVKQEYSYQETFVQGCYAGGTAALLLNNEEERTKSVVIFRKDADAPITRSFEREIKCIGLMPESGELLVQLRSQLQRLRFDGETDSTVPISERYDSFVRIDTELFLLGYTSIDKQSIG